LERIDPRVVLVANLFRDQLDRYHEVDQLARRMVGAFETLPPSTTVVLNADDPIVSRLAEGRAGTVYFGVDDPSVGGRVPQSISHATHCPRCHARLDYTRVVLAHVGEWSCPSCGLARPARDVSAVRVETRPGGTRMHLASPAPSAIDPIDVPLPGLYNA